MMIPFQIHIVSSFPTKAKITGLMVALLSVVFASSVDAQAASSAGPALSPLTIGRGALELLPLDDLTDLLVLRPGSFPLFGRDYQMRAARRGDEVLLIDGVPVRNQTFGLTMLKPSLTGLERVELDASLADVSVPGGVGGAVRLQSLAPEAGIEGMVRLTTEEFMPEWSLGANRLEASAAGRVGSAFTFSAGLNAQGNRSSPFTSHLKGIPLYNITGIDTTVAFDSPDGSSHMSVAVPQFSRAADDGQIPFSARDDYGANVRLGWELGAHTSMGGGLYISRTQTRDPFGAPCNCAAFRPTSQNGTFARSRVAALTMDHTLSDALRIRAYAAQANDRFQSGALDPEFAVNGREPSFGFTTADFEFLVDADVYRVNDELVERFVANLGERTPFDPDRSEISPATEYRFSPYGTHQFITRGIAGQHQYSEEKRLNAGIAGEYVAGRHRIDAGFDGSRIDTRFITVQYRSLARADLFVEKPAQYGAFLRDRLTLGDIDIDLGVRLDYFSSGARFSEVPGYRNPTEPEVKAEAVTAISPQVGATYRHDERTSLAARFARSARVPDLVDLFKNLNGDFFRFRNSTADDGYARPLDLITAEVIEFTGTRLLANGVFDIALFRNRETGMPARRVEMVEDPTSPGSQTALTLIRGTGERTVDGATVRLSSRSFEERGWSIAYTVAKADYSGGRPAQAKADPLADLPMTGELGQANDVWHSINGVIATDLGVLGSSELLRRTTIGATVAAASEVGTSEPLLQSELREMKSGWLQQVDLRLQHALPVAGGNARIVLDLRNLLASDRRIDVNDFPAGAVEGYVDGTRQTLGGGFMQDALDLRADQPGIRTEADRAALLQTEGRFGNGDGIFSAEEQISAFTEAARFRLAAALPGNPGRRLRIGVSVDF